MAGVEGYAATGCISCLLLILVAYNTACSIPTPGKLHFVKFESSKIEECMDFMEAKRLHRSNGGNEPMRVKATGGGAFKYAEVECSFRGCIEDGANLDPGS